LEQRETRRVEIALSEFIASFFCSPNETLDGMPFLISQTLLIFRLQLTEINHLEIIEILSIRFKISNSILKVSLQSSEEDLHHKLSSKYIYIYIPPNRIIYSL